jgi:very-short-patch-repair endonuclease
MTSSEKRLWEGLRRLDMGFRRQVPFGKYVADFATHAAKLIVEVDGGWHDFPDAQARDAERDAWLNSRGYRVLRVRDTAIFDDIEKVVAEVATATRETLPPRRGKGRDGGETTAVDGLALMAPLESFSSTSATPPPSPALPPSRGKGEE